MRQMLEHPEIEWALRTGYPSWMQPSEDPDVDEEEDDYEDEEYWE